MSEITDRILARLNVPPVPSPRRAADDEPPWEPPDEADPDDYVPHDEPPPAANSRSEPSSMFRRYSAAELVAMPRQFSWLARRLLVRPTYGQIAGEMKTLKTYLKLMVDVGVASGRPILDTFEVDQPGPVVAYFGEGGRVPITRRLERVAQAMGVDLDSVPLYVSFDVAPVQSPTFRASLRRDLEELRPALVGLDPLYAFHGAETKASDLHAEGHLLSSLSGPCMEAGASLVVVNHFNQTGTGHDLKRITQAGSGEWVDSWLLVSHREAPDVDNGRFRLLLHVGSRQWGGASWDVDLDVGRFDADTGEYDGGIEWSVSRHVEAAARDDIEDAILMVLNDRPWAHTKTDVVEAVKGNAAKVRATFDRLAGEGRLACELVPRVESGVSRKRTLWALVREPRPGVDGVGPG